MSYQVILDKHAGWLRENAAECAVLLKKDGRFPLTSPGRIAAYGSGVRHTLKGGTGSGEVNVPYVSVEEGLKSAGFHIASTAWLDGYDKLLQNAEAAFLAGIKKEARKKHMMAVRMAMGRVMEEPEYNLPLDGDAETAVYVLSRVSGEGSDRMAVPGDILLTETEIRDIIACSRKYRNFMLVLNVGGMVDLSPVMEVGNILILSQLGADTGHILADIILGKSNPSGHLTTTWHAWKDHPDMIEFGKKDDTHYREGIYVGYRYFDTAGIEPLFPFGFGLSFTGFQTSDPVFRLESDTVLVSADVTNTGNLKGKQVLQLYVSVPCGRLDQPCQALAGFSKTKALMPGETERLTVSCSMSELASYDEAKEAYVLEAGDYIFRLGTDSRHTEPVGIIRVGQEIICGEFGRLFGDSGFSDYRPEKTGAAARNDFNVPVFCISQDVITIRRAIKQSADIDDTVREMTDEQLMKMNIGAFNPKEGIKSIIGNAAFSVAGAAGQSYMGADNQGVPSLVMADGTGGLRISSEFVRDKNGAPHAIGVALPDSFLKLVPKILILFMKSLGYHPKKNDAIEKQPVTAIPIGTAVAQSFSVDFAEGCGDIVASDMEQYGVHLWLGPAMNIQRDIRCGRNFEYYSEDPVVSGEIAAAIIRGVQKHPGCGATVKHFACNNQELNRTQNNSHVSERAIREIYLKGFAIAIRKSQPAAVMTSYNLLNGIHTAEHSGLIGDYLRGEAGFQGIVMTDWIIANYATEKDCRWPIATAAGAAAAGGNLFMPGSNYDFKGLSDAVRTGKITREQLMINASKTVKIARELTKTALQ